MPPHVRRGGARGRSNTPRHAAQARADLSAGRSAPRTQGKFAAFDEFCKRLTWLGSRTVWKSSPRGIRVVIGSDAPFHNYKTKLYKRYHLIRIGIKNDSQDVALTNCEVELHTISGMFSQRCPISKSGFTLNPGAILYVDFVGLEESGSDAAYDAMDRKYGIRTYFPINPLPSDGSSWLDDQPYNISLLATAAESRPHRLDCRLFVEDGILMLRAAD